MADSIRQQLVDLVIAAVEDIDGTGSFQTSIGTTVTDWGLNFQEDELPAVSVCDTSETVIDDGQGEGYGELFDLMRLDVQIRIQFRASDRPGDCRLAIADVLTALRGNERWNNGTTDLALATDFKSAQFILDEEKFLIAAAAVDVQIFYRTQKFNAFSQ